jgi:hypothetical protein
LARKKPEGLRGGLLRKEGGREGGKEGGEEEVINE